MREQVTPTTPHDGVLVVDKPAGMTSHDVVQRVRRLVGQRRVGHTGTLDPDATGVLVVCLGRATRLVRFLQGGRKTYAARLVLGRETTTQDAAGDVVAETPAAHIDEHALCVALLSLQGEIQQVPPMVSAVRVGGERLHDVARRGETVEREARAVTVHDLVLEDFVPGEHPEAGFLVTCSAGTYVRTLAHDAGRALGVGAHLRSLRRLSNGPFTTEDAMGLDGLEAVAAGGTLAHHLLDPAQAARRALPTVEVADPARLLALAQGKTLPAQGLEEVYAVVGPAGLVGVYRDREGAGRPEAVFLQPNQLEGAARDERGRP